LSPGATYEPKIPRQALALGLGSMFNHRRNPNVAWERNLVTESIRYFTLSDVLPGEELCISYGPKLWFEDVDGPTAEDKESENDVLLTGEDIFA
jgi:SET domain-containing protein